MNFSVAHLLVIPITIHFLANCKQKKTDQLHSGLQKGTFVASCLEIHSGSVGGINVDGRTCDDFYGGSLEQIKTLCNAKNGTITGSTTFSYAKCPEEGSKCEFVFEGLQGNPTVVRWGDINGTNACPKNSASASQGEIGENSAVPFSSQLKEMLVGMDLEHSYSGHLGKTCFKYKSLSEPAGTYPHVASYNCDVIYNGEVTRGTECSLRYDPCKDGSGSIASKCHQYSVNSDLGEADYIIAFESPLTTSNISSFTTPQKEIMLNAMIRIGRGICAQ